MKVLGCAVVMVTMVEGLVVGSGMGSGMEMVAKRSPVALPQRRERRGRRGRDRDRGNNNNDNNDNNNENDDNNNNGGLDQDAINQFCSDLPLAQDKTITGGLQTNTGSFSTTIHGNIPATTTQVKIVEPPMLAVFEPNEPVTFRAQATEFALTVFTDAQTEYYANPLSLEGNNPIGHVHFTCELVEPIGNGANDTADLEDGNQFDFFKGVNEGNADNLEAIDEDGFAQPGLVRCCILPAAGSHQCLVLPELNRPAEMDCTYIIIREGGVAGQPDDLEPFGLFQNTQFVQE